MNNFVVEIEVDSPEPEQKLDIKAYLRKAIAVEINIYNPFDEIVQFDVDKQVKMLYLETIYIFKKKLENSEDE